MRGLGAQPEFYFELANAYSKTNQDKESIPYYKEALRRDPLFPAAHRGYAAALTHLGGRNHQRRSGLGLRRHAHLGQRQITATKGYRGARNVELRLRIQF